MAIPGFPLRAVTEADAPASGRATGSDLALLGGILAVALVPLAGEAAHGHWGQGTLGVAAAMALLSSRELVLEIGRRARARRRPE